MRTLVIVVAMLGLISCAPQPVDPVRRVTSAAARGPDLAAQRRGAAYAVSHCAACHAIGPTGESPLLTAPHFRALGVRYPIENLAEAFAEGIDTAHAAMPEFIMSTEENADLIIYLKSIQGR